jgi:hypothetical protein
MPNLRSLRLTVPSLAAVAALAMSAPAANAQDVGGIDVQGRAPTTLRIDVRRMDPIAVSQVVRAAARTVCGNAIGNREVDLGDFIPCRDASVGKAMKSYAAMTSSRHEAPFERALYLAAR